MHRTMEYKLTFLPGNLRRLIGKMILTSVFSCTSSALSEGTMMWWISIAMDDAQDNNCRGDTTDFLVCAEVPLWSFC